MALPANHATGQTITAADVNAIETAVNALSGTSVPFTLPGGWVSGNAGTRSAIESVTACPSGTGASFAGLEGVVRYPFALPLTPTRFRLRISTKSPAGNGSAVPIVGAFVGPASIASTGQPQGSGAFASTPTQVDSNFTLPANGDYVSPWISAATLGLTRGQLFLVSLGLTFPASGGQWGVGSQAWFATLVGVTGAPAGCSASAGSLTVGGMASFNQPLFDVRVEYEFSDARPVGLVLGDSLSAFFAQNPDGAIFQSWPSIVARRSRYALINASVVGASLTDFTTFTGNWRYDRLNLASRQLDFAVIALGSNDANSGASIATMRTNRQTLINGVRSTLGIQQVHVATVPPRGFTGTALQAEAPAGSTSILTWDSMANGTYTLGGGSSAESVTVSAVSGSGPYTLTVGALTNQHLPGEPLFGATTAEGNRRAFNSDVMRSSDGVAPLDFDAAARWSANPTKLDPMIRYSDGIHIMSDGQARLATVVPGVLI